MKRLVLAYGLAVLSVACAAGLTAAIWVYVQPTATPLFFAAVMVTTMYAGLGPGILATVLSAVGTAYFFTPPEFSLAIGTDDIFRLTFFGLIALLTSYLVGARRRADEGRKRTVKELQAALARIKTLSDLLPICPHCKRVRSEGERWESLEVYVERSSDLQVSHALCPDCARSEYPEYFQPPES